ncbi:hypothetical protein HLB44_24900 [Aquincola sp. S2]|uniref:Glycosyltransferase family 1 protein n=1 Tax=Pseudaquabacterium terrae TaxID=2732868 RepID=A0ABX2ENM8_9BURK|nr:hypothetical protein [Aquabacterium terrae]NRF70251.1 hypothetical protein [Aquabacterium terrae]
MSAAHYDALFVLQRSDVIHLAAHQERYADTRLLFVDPGILDAAVAAGFGHYEFRRLDVGADINTAVYAEAQARASRIDQRLTRERTRLFGRGQWSGWDQAHLYLFFQRALTIERLGQAAESSFPEARLGLLRPSNPQLFNFDSMLSTEIVAGNSARWQIVDTYGAGRFWNPAMLEWCFDAEGVRAAAAGVAVEALTHIPTCFYDARGFAQAIEARFETSIDLPGLYCDVPVRRGATLLLKRIDELSAAQRPIACELYAERARAVFIDELSALVPNRAALELQAATLARRCLMQALNYHGLYAALAGQQPRIIVADHDTGNNGPLFSLAHALRAPVTVLPHSAYPTSPLPHADQVEAVELPGFAPPVRTVLGAPVARRAVAFRARPQPTPRPAARRICLLLNTMQSEGLSYIDFFGLIGFYKGLRELCARHDRDLVVRLKPSTPALNVVSGALGEPAGFFQRTMAQPLDQVAAEADICVAYGEPTSGTVTFLDAGSWVVHVGDQHWAADYVITPPYVSDGLVPSFTGAAALRELDAVLASPQRYSDAQATQARAYACRCRATHDDLFPSSSPTALQGA